MSVSNTRGVSLKRAALAFTAVGAAVALSACSPNEEPSNVPGTTPPVVTGNQAIPGDLVNADGIEAPNERAIGNVSLIDLEGKTVGAATFVPAHEGVKVTLRVAGVPRGQHEVSIHAEGDCGGDTSFSGVGSVLSGGNLPGISVGADGKGSVTQNVGTLNIGQLNGKSMVISQTDGDQQYACGVITAN